MGLWGLAVAVILGGVVVSMRRTESGPRETTEAARAARVEAVPAADAGEKIPAQVDVIQTELHRATNDGFAQEVEVLLAGRTQNSIPKIAAVVVRWVAVDPKAAMLFLEKLPSNDFRRRGASRAGIEAWLKLDAGAALEFAKEAVWRDAANSDYLDLVFKSLARTGGVDPYGELKRYLDQLPQLEAVYSQVTQAIGAEVKNNLPAAEAFNESLPLGMRFYGVLGGAKAQAWGFAAVETLAARASAGAGDREQLAGAVNILSRKSPAELTAWLATQPVDHIFDYARTRLAVDAYTTEPEKAQRIAGQLSSAEERRSYAGDFLEYWLRKDFAAAEAWAVASDLPVELVGEKLAKVTAPKTFVDYEPKLNATLEIADERLKRRAQYAVQGWLQQDRAAALKWMATQTKTEADREFFARMARSVPESEPLGPVIILE